MKYSLLKEHKDFFNKNGWIEFEDIISLTHLNQINETIENILSSRSQIPFRKNNSESLFLHGHDLWRSDEKIRQLICYPRLTETVAELIEDRFLRIGYDQFFPAVAAGHDYTNEQVSAKPYAQFCALASSLEVVSSIEGLLAGVMICLKGDSSDSFAKEPSVKPVDVYPKHAGQIIIFGSHEVMNWNLLPHHPSQTFLLIAYTQQTSFYKPKDADPHGHDLKRLGYIINDKLNNKLHPLIYR